MPKPKPKPAKKVAPARSNKGGATTGQARAAQVQAMNKTKKAGTVAKAPPATAPRNAPKPAPASKPLSLPSSPNILRNAPVPQWSLFSGIGRTIQQATGQGRRRRTR